MIDLGMDVHKDSITIAVLPQSAKTPTRLEKLANDLPRLTQWMERVARQGEIRAGYGASGAGDVRHRALAEWGDACDVIAPSLIPKRSGVHRKHDQRDVVRCRETFQRAILKSRHDILEFRARRGFVDTFINSGAHHFAVN